MLLPYVVVKSVSSRPEKVLIAEQQTSAPEHKTLSETGKSSKGKRPTNVSMIGRLAQSFDQ